MSRGLGDVYKRQVYGADTRIRDLAGAYGMVEPSESVTLDFSQDAAAGANATATAQ